MLTSWEGCEPRQLYAAQLEATKAKARRVQHEIDHIREDCGQSSYSPIHASGAQSPRLAVPMSSLSLSGQSSQRPAGSGYVSFGSGYRSFAEAPCEVMWSDAQGDVSTLSASSGKLMWSAPGFKSRPVARLTFRCTQVSGQFAVQGPLGRSTITNPKPGLLQISLLKTLATIATAAGVPVEDQTGGQLVPVDERHAKIDFLTAQIGVYAEVTKMLVSQAAQHELDDIHLDVPEANLACREIFYCEAARLLSAMSETFDCTLLVPAATFARASTEAALASRAVSSSVRSPRVSPGDAVSEPATRRCCRLCGTVDELSANAVLNPGPRRKTWFLGRISAQDAAAVEPLPKFGRDRLEEVLGVFRDKDLPPEALGEIRELFVRCFATPLHRPWDERPTSFSNAGCEACSFR